MCLEYFRFRDYQTSSYALLQSNIRLRMSDSLYPLRMQQGILPITCYQVSCTLAILVARMGYESREFGFHAFRQSVAYQSILKNHMGIGKVMQFGDIYIPMKRLLKLWPPHLNNFYNITSTTAYYLGLGNFIFIFLTSFWVRTHIFYVDITIYPIIVYKTPEQP